MATVPAADTRDPISTPVAAVSSRRLGEKRRRSISPEAGRALEILGHAIEYLADEFAHQGGPLTGDSPEWEAIQLLMACNREVYFACPEVPNWRVRLFQFMRAHVFGTGR